MDRRQVGAAAWVASAVLLPVQLVVALKWPTGYSLTRNAISDLGVTVCGQFSEQGQQVREVCSPWHPLFNAGMILSGVLVAVGALLLHGWWDSRTGRGGTILMLLSGLLVVLVGFAPWDVRPQLHDNAALGAAAAQWVGMCVLAAAAGSGSFRRAAVATVVVSLAGFGAFVSALDGSEVAALGFGLAERLSFDTLTLWTAFAGAALLTDRQSADPTRAPGASATQVEVPRRPHV